VVGCWLCCLFVVLDCGGWLVCGVYFLLLDGCVMFVFGLVGVVVECNVFIYWW